jgi:hypothetical protein
MVGGQRDIAATRILDRFAVVQRLQQRQLFDVLLDQVRQFE